MVLGLDIGLLAHQLPFVWLCGVCAAFAIGLMSAWEVVAIISGLISGCVCVCGYACFVAIFHQTISLSLCMNICVCVQMVQSALSHALW